MGINQRIENVQTFAGQTATISFWAKADSARTLTVFLQQNFGSGGSATVSVSTQTTAITTSWARYSFTATYPSIAGKTIGTSSFVPFFIYFAAGQASGSPELDVWGVQIEAGSVATAFQTATGTIQGERSACERYYWRVNGVAGANSFGWPGISANATTAYVTVGLPTTMRVTPTSLDFSAVGITNTTGYTNAASALGLETGTPNTFRLTLTSTGMTGNQATQMCLQSNGYLGFSAEL
jgi:hypothetical protein